MNTIDKSKSNWDGGPAFPTIPVPHECPGSPEAWNRGMSLRDYFAGQVIFDLIHYCANRRSEGWSEMASEMAYKTADDMLKAREKKS